MTRYAENTMNYPSDRAGREAMRQDLVDRAVNRARSEARVMGLSLNCQDGLYFGHERHRCRNDGSGCLCVCHDPVEKERATSDKPKKGGRGSEKNPLPNPPPPAASPPK